MMGAYAAPGVYVEEVPAAAPIVGVGTSTPAFVGVWPDPEGAPPTAAALAAVGAPGGLAAVGEVKACTNFTDFKNAFGEPVKNADGELVEVVAYSKTNNAQNLLAHAVKGFFLNGGTFCYVVRAATAGDIASQALAKLEAYDDVAMVVAPGLTGDPSQGVVTAIWTHCKFMGDRIAILDAPNVDPVQGLKPLLPGQATSGGYPATDFAALYTPWVVVFDPATNAEKEVPPSGHVAGVYARTDATRGVHKAPANEQVLGVIRPAIAIGKSQQAAINLLGANCIRPMNGAIKIWGARTLDGEASLKKYVPIRRLLSFLYKSIDHGTQWAVFEPNNSDLWARLIRNVSSFLTSVWAQGALAGTVPQEAFYVKCDAENNPPDQRSQGRLMIEVGVATVFPAEFVVFRVQQHTGPIK